MSELYYNSSFQEFFNILLYYLYSYVKFYIL